MQFKLRINKHNPSNTGLVVMDPGGITFDGRRMIYADFTLRRLEKRMVLSLFGQEEAISTGVELWDHFIIKSVSDLNAGVLFQRVEANYLRLKQARQIGLGGVSLVILIPVVQMAVLHQQVSAIALVVYGLLAGGFYGWYRHSASSILGK